MPTKSYFREGREVAKQNPHWTAVRDARQASLTQQCAVDSRELDARFFFARNREAQLVTILQGAPSVYVLALSVVRALIFLAATWFLFQAGVFFLRLVFEATGMTGELLSIAAVGTAVLTFGAVHEALSAWQRKKIVFFSLCATAVVLSIAVQVLLAYLRAELLIAMMNAASGAEINGAVVTGDVPEAVHRFYQRAYHVLPMAVPLLSVALELGGGALAYVALDRLFSPDLLAHLKLNAVRRSMTSLAREKAAVQALPQIFHNEFTAGALVGEHERLQAQAAGVNAVAGQPMSADFKLAVAIPVVIIAVVLLMFALAGSAGAQTMSTPPPDEWVLLDLSRSSEATDGIGQAAFTENCVAVEKLLQARLAPGTNVQAYAITDRSFERPYRLLSAKMPVEPGYFGQNVTAAKSAILNQWKTTCAKLKPDFEV